MIQTQRNGKHVALLAFGDKESVFEADTYAEVWRWSKREEDAKEPSVPVDDPAVKPTTAKPVKPGDFVQWTSGGVDMFVNAKKLTRVKDGFGFVKDSETGMPLDELTKTSKGDV